ncbi:DUF418 domain-containing protein [Carboxylicivirga sp. N1Y90]|uniref:DUF418 domain-containing protein n=1 Tax=Carboxylicivirga fragile TaxID=3417571 RepID=UPI003D34407A|nr:DUF418 domain-containing protein [Marinilabiliaceae bacterium N1Y90]
MNQTEMKPTLAKNRIIFLDVLRGFALVGILYANILSWSGLKFLPFDSIIALGNIETDKLLYNLLKFFVDTKFYTIFSLLFGIGFYIQFSRNGEKDGFNKTYLKRLGILFAVGVIHALCWSGDILTLYALMGVLLWSMRKLPTKKLLWTAIILFTFPIFLDIIYMFTFAQDIVKPEATALKTYADMAPAAVVEGFRSSNYLDVFRTNLHNLYWRWYDFIPSGRPFKVLGLFMLGFYLHKTEFITVKSKQIKYLLPLIILGVTFTGLAATMTGSIASFSKSWSNVLYKLTHEVGQVSLGLAYIGLLALLVDKFPKFFLFAWLKNYGQQSMSSYIGHTVIGILIFYPIIAWGYFGELTLQQTFTVAAGILVFQFAFSYVWFKFFSFGPIEWLWRCATYGKWFPIRKQK